jgi:hypothetical protein
MHTVAVLSSNMPDFDAVRDKASEIDQRFKGNSDEVTFWWAPRGEIVEFSLDIRTRHSRSECG